MSTPTDVTARVNYIAPDAPPPELAWREPREGEVFHAPQWAEHAVKIKDIRGQEDAFSLDEHGFAVIDFDVDVDPEAELGCLEVDYFPRALAAVKKASGARDAIAFDHNYRRAGVSYDRVADAPAMHVHNDYTDISAERRIRDMLGQDLAEQRLAQRYCYINLWRPIRHKAEDLPLAVLASASIGADDFVKCMMRWPDRDGETYVLKHNPAHQWFYLSNMEPNRALLLKCFDTELDGRARFAPHSAFVNPASPTDAKPRESFEVRTIAFF